MIVSSQRRFIFIHICKNAGTSIRRALRPYTIPKWQANCNQVFKRIGISQFRSPLNREHATASQAIEEFGRRFFDSCFSFAIVRNPWDWEVSQYKYILKDKGHPLHETVKNLASFENYLSWKSKRGFRLQQDFIDHEGREVVSFVGRFENLNNDFRAVTRRLKIKATLSKKNSTRPVPYQTLYTPDLVDLVRTMYRPDIDRFGYQFTPLYQSKAA